MISEVLITITKLTTKAIIQCISEPQHSCDRILSLLIVISKVISNTLCKIHTLHHQKYLAVLLYRLKNQCVVVFFHFNKYLSSFSLSNIRILCSLQKYIKGEGILGHDASARCAEVI